MKRVIAYLRVSTEQQDTERQLNQIKNYCFDNDYSIVKVIEDKVTGTISNREGLIELLRCNSSVADMVIVSEQSRFSREKNIMSVLSSITNVLYNGLDLMFLDNPNKVYVAFQDLDINELLLLIMGAYASNIEKDKIIYRLKSGKDAIFEKDCFAQVDNNAVPFGFKSIPNPLYNGIDKISKNIIVKNDVEVIVIKEIFDLYVNHNLSLNKICIYLKSKGYNFVPSVLKSIMENKIYKGERWRKGKLIHYIEPIIEPELFNMVSIKAKENILIKDNSTKYINPYKGIIKCRCGSSMYIAEGNNNILRYACFAQAKKNYKECNNTAIGKDIINKVVNNALKRTSTFELFNEKNNEHIEQLNRQIEVNKEIIKSKYIIASEIENKINNTINAISETDIKQLRDSLTIKYNTLNEELLNINSEIKTLSSTIDEINNRITSLNMNNIAYKEYTETELKDIAIKIFDSIVYYSFNSLKGCIQLNFKNGISMLYAIRKNGGKRVDEMILSLPDSFTFNIEYNKIQVEVMKPDIMSFSFNNFECRYYDFNELLMSFDYNDWIIN